MKITRIILYPKDIERLTGKSDRQARTTMARIRKRFGKEPRQPITIQEYCLYTGISESEVIRALTTF